MTVDERLLEVRDYAGQGYLPLIDYGAWRVAVLRWVDELMPGNITHMQRHDETDEVFVLLAGRCILFIGEGEAHPERIFPVDMQPLKLYNVKKGCWHTHTLTQDATVLIVENLDTTVENSPQIALNDDQRGQLVVYTKELWSEA